MANALPLLGRIALSLTFLLSTVGKITDPAGTQAFMASYGMPLTGLLMWGAVAFELVGGLSVLLGYRARWGAVLLAVFLVPATLIFHTGFGEQEQVIHFLKNVAILGGLAYVAVYGAGPFSLDNRRGTSRVDADGLSLSR